MARSVLASAVENCKAHKIRVEHKPPPTGDIPEQFAGSAFDPSLDTRVPEVPVAVKGPNPGDATKTFFDGKRDSHIGPESGTQAFLSKGKKKDDGDSSAIQQR